MAQVTMYHNPQCSKSRQTLALLAEHGVEAEVVEYLQTPPDAKALDALLQKLGLEPQELMRTSEDEYEALGLAAVTDRAQLIQALVEHPILLERPIVVKGGQARIGRPPERVLDLL